MSEPVVEKVPWACKWRSIPAARCTGTGSNDIYGALQMWTHVWRNPSLAHLQEKRRVYAPSLPETRIMALGAVLEKGEILGCGRG